MTLDEAIKHCKEKAEHLRDGVRTCQSMSAPEQADCLECAKEHEQLAEWLEELKEWRKLKEEQRPQGGKWIPIKTRKPTEEEKEEYPDCEFMYDCKLPEDGEEVLVTTWYGDTDLDNFCRDDGCYFEKYCDEEDVIAWMPKPEPYKKGGAE